MKKYTPKFTCVIARPAFKTAVKITVRNGVAHTGNRVLRRIENPYMQLLLGHPVYEGFVALFVYRDLKTARAFLHSRKARPRSCSNFADNDFRVYFVDADFQGAVFSDRVDRIWSAMLSREKPHSYVSCPLVEITTQRELDIFNRNHSTEGVVICDPKKRAPIRAEIATAKKAAADKKLDNAVREALRGERKRVTDILKRTGELINNPGASRLLRLVKKEVSNA